MQIRDAKYITSSPTYEDCPATDQAEFAFIGRSNVGKSSLINMLMDNQKLAKVSGTPGKTQLLNHFQVTALSKSDAKGRKKELNFFIVDLPGYGFAKVAQKSRRRWEQMIEGYVRKRKNLAHLFVLIDSRHEPQEIDLSFINKLGEWSTPFSLVFTKVDKNKPKATERHINEFLEELRKNWEAPPVFFVTSAITKQGSEEILKYIEDLNYIHSLG